MQIKRFLYFNDIPLNKQIFVTTEYFHKKTKDWIQPLINKYSKNGTDNKDIFDKFIDLTKKIITIFKFTNNKLLVEQKLLNFNQKKLVSNYVAIFQKYITKTK